MYDPRPSREASASEPALEALLAESSDAAAQRAAGQLELRATDPLVLYGAGRLGRRILQALRSAGVEPAAFAEDTRQADEHRVVDGLTVLRPDEVVARFGPAAVAAVTISSPKASYLRIRERLMQRGAFRVISFVSLMWRYPETFLPHLMFALPQHLLAHRTDIRRAYRVFADEQSRRQFVGHLRFRLRLEYEALPAADEDGYFPTGVVPILPPDTVFVDGGAFDGDSVRSFLSHQRGHFGAAHAFEPDPENCRRLRTYVASLAASQAARIHVHQAALGARRGRLRLDASGTTAAALHAAGDLEVAVVPLDEIVRADRERPLYLKLDVEGSEAEALAGAARLIADARPLLAVCVYHRPADLWELPLAIQALDPGYRLYLRTHGEDGADLVCYAIPS
jgi:FkbM family methyltransferase